MEYPENNFYRSSSVCEIEEEEDHNQTQHHLGPIATIHGKEEEEHEQDCVYVAVGKSNTSMYALSWTLNNLVTQSTIIYLIHVFPQIKHIPNPSKLSHLPSISLFLLSQSQINVGFTCSNPPMMFFHFFNLDQLYTGDKRTKLVFLDLPSLY